MRPLFQVGRGYVSVLRFQVSGTQAAVIIGVGDVADAADVVLEQ